MLPDVQGGKRQHVINITLWFQALPGSVDHFSYHEIFFLRGSKGVKTDAVDKDYLPRSKFKSRCFTYTSMSIFFLSLRRGNHFHDMGRFSNLLVVCLFLTFRQMCFLLMFDLRQKLGVTIQHLIGSNMEPLLLGCGNSSKVRPKVLTRRGG